MTFCPLHDRMLVRRVLMALDPEAHSVSAVVGAPLPATRRLFTVLPQISSLVEAKLILFARTYGAFQRQEVRA